MIEVTDNEGRTSVKLLGDSSLESLGEPVLTTVKVNDLVESIYLGTDSNKKSEITFEEKIAKYASAYENDVKIDHPIGEYCGSCEFKLLPPLFSDIPMEKAEQFITDKNIANGGAALTAYAKMQFTGISENEKILVEQGLLRYCELDTLAMVIIYEYWLNEISRI